jgi:hypothetical protein
MMLSTLEKYFLNQGQLVIPNIGQLRLDQKEAYCVENQFYAPNVKIVFEPFSDLPMKPSKLFYIYLSDHLDCSIEQAMIDYDSFFSTQLANNQFIHLGNLGQLTLKQEQYIFESNFNSDQYFSTITMDKVLEIDQDENNFTNTQMAWWIFPLIIAMVAMLAIFLKS